MNLKKMIWVSFTTEIIQAWEQMNKCIDIKGGEDELRVGLTHVYY